MDNLYNSLDNLYLRLVWVIEIKFTHTVQYTWVYFQFINTYNNNVRNDLAAVKHSKTQAWDSSEKIKSTRYLGSLRVDSSFKGEIWLNLVDENESQLVGKTARYSLRLYSKLFNRMQVCWFSLSGTKYITEKKNSTIQT